MYTDDKILKSIKSFYEEYSYMPTQKDYECKDYEIPIELCMLIFNNWENVIKSTCDLFYDDYKLCHTCRKLFPNNDTYFSKDNSINVSLQNLCKSCEEREENIKKDKEIAEIKEKNELKAEIEGKIVENDLLKEQVKILHEKIKVTKEIKMNKKELFELISGFYDKNNCLPSEEEFRKYRTDINIDIWIKQFGTWGSILRKFYNEYKFCPHCKNWLPSNNTFFGKDKSTNSGLQCWCKECKKEERKKRYKIDKKMGKSNDYYEENRLRHIASSFKKRGFPNITEKDLQKIIDNFKNEYGKSICPYCGRKIEDERDIQFDHFIPYYKKDKNIPLINLIPVCKYCNRSKHDEDFDDWYKEQSFYNLDREEKILKYLNDNILEPFYTNIDSGKADSDIEQHEQYIVS